MLSETARSALLDIQDNINLAQDFVAGLLFETFQLSRLHFYAVIRALEIISEASRRLPDDLKQKHSHLPWRAIRDVGNVHRHNYDNVAESFVWMTVKDHLAPLLAMTVAEIEAVERNP